MSDGDSGSEGANAPHIPPWRVHIIVDFGEGRTLGVCGWATELVNEGADVQLMSNDEVGLRSTLTLFADEVFSMWKRRGIPLPSATPYFPVWSGEREGRGPSHKHG